MSAVLSVAMAATLLVGCGGSAPATDTSAPAADTAAETKTEETAAPAADTSDKLISVGIINNDPNESGYRTANDADLKKTFSKENGYDAQFAYSLKNDEQIAAAQKFEIGRASCRERVCQLV